MIIKCHTIYNHITKKYCMEKNNASLTKGKNYLVMQLYFIESAVYYRIIADNSTEYTHPILIRAEDFSIVSGKIPPNWVLNRFNEFGVTLGPEKWSNPDYWEEDFWDDWSNGNEKAIKCYNEELAIIKMTDQDLLYS